MADKVDRLLRAAAAAPNESLPEEVPFGFDTRVVANWRAQPSANGNGSGEFARFFQRIAAAAVVIAVSAGAGAFWQLRQSDELDDASGGGYTIADNAIEANVLQ